MTNNIPQEQDGVTRRDFLKAGAAAGVVAVGGMGGFYFGYGAAVGKPVRVGVIGTGDEGSVLLGAINPNFMEVRSVCDIRPYNRYRALHGQAGESSRPGLMSVYGWKSESEALKHVKVYKGSYQELIANAKADRLEAVIIALPLHLHAPAAIAAMQAGLHVITEKLMGHSVHECKEMARVAKQTGLHLATGHQRHYNILYANAMDMIQRGVLGDLHYIRAQWHRSNLPGKDSWQQPLPPDVEYGVATGTADKKEKANELVAKLKDYEKQLAKCGGVGCEKLLKQIAEQKARIEDKILDKKDKNGKTLAEMLDYETTEIKYRDNDGKDVVYRRPAIEELIRWRLWDRTGAGLMAELGSHQLDAASIFVSAMHDGVHQHPLNVIAAGNRPLFPPDRDCEDHVYCVIEFPAPGYDKKDSLKKRKKIGVQYASINGNGFGGYGEIVYGTKGTLILEKEQEISVYPSGQAAGSSVKVAGGAGPTMDTQASGPPPASAGATVRVGGGGGGEPTMDTQASGPSRASKVSRGYTEELEHFAWCIRNPSPENQPRCYPKKAMADAVIALVTNMAARKGERIEFKEAWFDPDSDETPEKVKPNVGRYKA